MDDKLYSLSQDKHISQVLVKNSSVVVDTKYRLAITNPILVTLFKSSTCGYAVHKKKEKGVVGLGSVLRTSRYRKSFCLVPGSDSTSLETAYIS